MQLMSIILVLTDFTLLPHPGFSPKPRSPKPLILPVQSASCDKANSKLPLNHYGRYRCNICHATWCMIKVPPILVQATGWHQNTTIFHFCLVPLKWSTLHHFTHTLLIITTAHLDCSYQVISWCLYIHGSADSKHWTSGLTKMVRSSICSLVVLCN